MRDNQKGRRAGMSGSIKLAHIRCQVMRGETLRRKVENRGKKREIEREREREREREQGSK